MIVSPSSSYIQYQFKCPYCKWTHWFSKNQLKHGLPHPCDCGNVFTPIIKGVKVRDPSEFLKKNNDERFKDLVKTLINWGWSRKESEKMINKVISPHKTENDILKEALYGK